MNTLIKNKKKALRKAKVLRQKNKRKNLAEIFRDMKIDFDKNHKPETLQSAGCTGQCTNMGDSSKPKCADCPNKQEDYIY